METTIGCLFCGIVDGTVASRTVYADNLVVAVIPPELDARVHLLLIPRRHIPSIDSLTVADRDLWWHLLAIAQRLAREQGIDVDTEGYQLATNAGRHGVREFPHFHLYLGSGALE